MTYIAEIVGALGRIRTPDPLIRSLEKNVLSKRVLDPAGAETCIDQTSWNVIRAIQEIYNLPLIELFDGAWIATGTLWLRIGVEWCSFAGTLV